MEVSILNLKEDYDGDHYDIEIRSKGRMSGNDFQALRRYLQAEGYIDAAKEWNSKVS